MSRLLVACALAAAAGWASLLARLWDPARLPGGYNADSAIPVLMANDERLGLESLYYWSQDRFGGFPMAVAQLVHRAFGVFWTPSAWALTQACWVLLSIAMVAWWTRRPDVTLLWACVPLISPWRELLFDICQPYAWQLTWTVLALALVARRLEDPSPRWPAGVALALVACQASWANSMSGLWLLALVLAELIFGRAPRRTVAISTLPWVLLGLAGEVVFRALAQRHYVRVHGFSIATNLVPRWAGLPKGLVAVLSQFSAWWLALPLAFTFIIVVVWVVRRNLPRWLAYPACCVALNIAAVALVAHTQGGDGSPKYVTVAGLFAPFVTAAALIASRPPAPWLVLPLAALLALGPLFAAPVPPDPAWDTELEFAHRLAAARPGAFLASGYWDTYRLASLVPEHALQPVARLTEYQRTPQLFDALAHSSEVWVGNGGLDELSAPEHLKLAPHVVIGRDVFVPREDVAPFERGLVLYRVAPSTRFKGRVCGDQPLALDVPRGATVVAMVSWAWDRPLVLEPMAASGPSREGLLWVWSAGETGGPHRLALTGDCAFIEAFVLAGP